MALARIRQQEPAHPIAVDPYAPWGVVGYVNMLCYFDPLRIADTPGDIAARHARQALDFHTLPQAERDRRVLAAMEAAA